MSINHIIKIKKLSEENEKKFYETDRPRFEEQDEEEYRKQRHLAIQVIVMSPYLFRSVPIELKNDIEICLLAIKSYPFNVKHLSSEMKKSQEIFFCLVKLYR